MILPEHHGQADGIAFAILAAYRAELERRDIETFSPVRWDEDAREWFIVLRSREWNTIVQLRFGRPGTEIEKFAGRGWSCSASEIAERLDDALNKLSEAPPFYVDEDAPWAPTSP